MISTVHIEHHEGMPNRKQKTENRTDTIDRNEMTCTSFESIQFVPRDHVVRPSVRRIVGSDRHVVCDTMGKIGE